MRAAFASESAFRQEVIVALLLLPVALLANVGRYERLALIASLILVMLVELLNSAVEAVVDRVSLQHHALSARAKDFGSAAVLLALLLALLTWGTILLPW